MDSTPNPQTPTKFPEEWGARIEARLQTGERVVAMLKTDLNQELHFTRFGVNAQHVSRPKTPFCDYLFWFITMHTDFRGHGYQTIFSSHPARRSQAVPV